MKMIAKLLEGLETTAQFVKRKPAETQEPV
jgi:hypothetical protein